MDLNQEKMGFVKTGMNGMVLTQTLKIIKPM